MDVKQDLVKYDVTDATIAEMGERYMPLMVSGPDDEVGFAAVHGARMIVKGKRVEVEKARKGLKAEAIDFGRRVDTEAKRITALLRPIEDHLIAQEKVVTDEKERQRQAAEDAERARLDAIEADKRAEEEARIRAEREAEVERLEAEREKLEAERAAMEAERDRVTAEQEVERKRLADIAAAQKAEADKLEAERARIAAEEAEHKRQAELEKAKLDAAAQAKADAEQRAIEAKAAEDKERELAALREAEDKRKAEQDKQRLEELRPDVDKIRAYGAAVLAVSLPIIKDRMAHNYFSARVNTIAAGAHACAAYCSTDLPPVEADPCMPK